MGALRLAVGTRTCGERPVAAELAAAEFAAAAQSRYKTLFKRTGFHEQGVSQNASFVFVARDKPISRYGARMPSAVAGRFLETRTGIVAGRFLETKTRMLDLPLQCLGQSSLNK